MDFWGRKQTSKVPVYGLSHWAIYPDIMPKHPAFTDAIYIQKAPGKSVSNY